MSARYFNSKRVVHTELKESAKLRGWIYRRESKPLQSPRSSNDSFPRPKISLVSFVLMIVHSCTHKLEKVTKVPMLLLIKQHLEDNMHLHSFISMTLKITIPLLLHPCQDLNYHHQNHGVQFHLEPLDALESNLRWYHILWKHSTHQLQFRLYLFP